jgi:S1-C subfamily serine protease
MELKSELERMDEATAAPSRWRQGVRRVGAGVRAGLPFGAGVLAALAALLLYAWLVPGPHVMTSSEVRDTVAQAMASATPPPPFSALVYQAVRPSLVLIETTITSTTDSKADTGLGSGVVVDDNADILTSLHVVANAKSIQVTFADGTQSSAQVAVRQPENDIAVLTPDQPPSVIVPAVLGNPNAMHVGEDAYVLGNPFGLYGSFSAGVISGFNRTFQPPGGQELQGLIQIDAAVNPGNSGGPLLNRAGQVIGIVTGIVNPTDQSFFVGIGLAVPINVAGGAAGLPPY